MRLKYLRDGVEDYEYLQLLKNCGRPYLHWPRPKESALTGPTGRETKACWNQFAIGKSDHRQQLRLLTGDRDGKPRFASRCKCQELSGR